MLAEEVVAERRQALNEEAYFEVLRALISRGETDMMKTIKIRQVLNITNVQHTGWVQQIRAAHANGQAAFMALSVSGNTRGGRAGSKQQLGAQRGGSQPLAQQRSLNRRGSKAQSLSQPQPSPEESRMVGYKVQYYLPDRGGWLTGVITAYRPPNIIITFNLGAPNAFSEVVKWEASDNLRMLQEMVDLRGFNLG